MNSITIGSEEFSAIATMRRDDHPETSRENVYYSYSVDRYLLDDYAVTTRNGVTVVVPRYTVEQGWEWSVENSSLLLSLDAATKSRDYWEQRWNTDRESVRTFRDRLNATTVAFERALIVTASKGRDYARDNELCENYERFVMLGVNREAMRISDPHMLDMFGDDVHTDENEAGRLYRQYMRLFVQHATRTRKARVVVGKRYNAYLTGNDAGSGVIGNEIADPYGYSNGEIRTVEGDPEVMTYEECVKANEYGIRNGWRYAANAFRVEEDNDSRGVYCEECDAYHSE